MDPVDNIWQVAFALLLIVAVVMLLGFVAKRFQITKGNGSGQLKVVDTAYLGPKERLVLVRVADQHVLLGMNPQCITKLVQFDADGDFAKVLEEVKVGRA